MNTYIESNKSSFQAAVDHLKQDIASLRTGRASPALVENILVEAYGSKTPINQLANISVPEPKMLIIQPWDKTVIKDIEKAIASSGSGLNPVNEGSKIRLVMPPMTEENRKELVKLLKQKSEKSKQALRSAREKVRGNVLDAEKNKTITEDDRFGFLKELDDYTQKVTEEINKITDDKEKEVMTI